MYVAQDSVAVWFSLVHLKIRFASIITLSMLSRNQDSVVCPLARCTRRSSSPTYGPTWSHSSGMAARSLSKRRSARVGRNRYLAQSSRTGPRVRGARDKPFRPVPPHRPNRHPQAYRQGQAPHRTRLTSRPPTGSKQAAARAAAITYRSRTSPWITSCRSRRAGRTSTDHLENLQLLCNHCNAVNGTMGQAVFTANLKNRD